MFANLNGWHALIVVVVILLLFGAPKIPALARSLGQSMRILKTEIREYFTLDPADLATYNGNPAHLVYSNGAQAAPSVYPWVCSGASRKSAGESGSR